MPLTYGSLFSGIGGLDLGVEMAIGARPLWFAESDGYARAVLRKHWPNVRCYENVKDVDEKAERPDIICGGFPCQDISSAGKRVGIDGERSGLWAEYARIVRDLRPRFVFVENVGALLVRGIDRVLGDLASLGYDAEWSCLRAADVGAPHLRRRVFILAHAEGARVGRVAERQEREHLPHAGRDSPGADVADAQGEPKREPTNEAHAVPDSGKARHELVDGRQYVPRENQALRDAEGHPERPGLRAEESEGRWGRRPGHPDWWAIEPDVGRVANGIPSRMDRIRCIGNAVVPQQAAAALIELLSRINTSNPKGTIP